MTDVQLTAAITHEGDWYVARCLQVEVASQGENVESALAMPTPHQPTPRWQPIASLPLIAHVIDGQLEAAEEQHRLLRLAQPGSLDNVTVERVVRVFTEEVELLAVYDEQLDRWRSGPLTGAQRLEVERLRGQLAHNRDVDAAVLSLAEQFKATTIDAILAKSDLELGLEVLTDRSPLFPRDPPRRPQP